MDTKKYTYILFDWDGCLAKTLDIWLDSYKETFGEYDLYPDNKIITSEVFGDWNGPQKLGIQNIKEYTEKLLKRVNAKYPRVDLYPNAHKIIETLKKRGKKLALLTSSARPTVEPALYNQNLHFAFDVLLTAEDVSKHKPDPEIINKALDNLKGNKEEAIIVGDSKSDLGAANNAGIDSLLFYPKHNELFYDLEILKTFNPTYITNDLIKVLEIIK